MNIRYCEICGKTLRIWQKYTCSIACKGKREKKETGGKCKNCKFCGRLFYTPGWLKEKGYGFYCSRKCHYKDETGKYRKDYHKIKRHCLNCGKRLKIVNVQQRKSKKYCSQECQWKYQGLLRRKDPKDLPSKYRLVLWARAVLKRGNCKCVECGSKEQLQAHHIKPKSKNKDLWYDLDNGQTLCVVCHAEKHIGEPCYDVILSKVG